MDDLALLERTARQQDTKYYGKYRGFVVDNKDPDKRGRVTLTVPSVLGEATSTWALPCLPYGGGSGFGFVAVPPVGSQVLVEFMEGDISTPLWTGTFWRTASEVPPEFTDGDEPTVKVMKTESGHLLTFEDKSGDEAIILQSAKQAKIEMDSKGSVLLTDAKGSKVTLDADANTLTIEDANGNSLEFSSSGFTCKDLNGNEITGAAAGITVKSTMVTIQGQMVAIGGSGGEPLVKGTTFLAMFNAHTHNCTAPGAPSGPPVPPLTPAVLSIAATTT
jgi:uncharacterized protein involved in type VI secretion and phage assembly